MRQEAKAWKSSLTPAKVMMGGRRRVVCDLRWRCFFIQSMLMSSRVDPCFGKSKSVTTFLSGPKSSYNARASRSRYLPSTLSTVARFVSTGTTDEHARNEDDDWDLILRFTDGSHNSAKIFIPETEPFGGQDAFQKASFGQRLEATIAACRELEKSSVWVEVPMSRASLIEEMVESGLRYHHATGDKATLCLWLDEEKDNKIPDFATHHVGVGSIVVNSRNEILCVRELHRNYRPWKIPGGLTELGEHLDEGAIREVMEETGVPCRFLSVLCVRHTHGIQFGRSDLYFVCRLEPIEETDDNGNVIIPEPVAQADEIETAAWVPLEEYKAMVNDPKGHPMMQHVLQLYEQDHEIERTVLSSIVPGRKPSPIYHIPIREKNNDGET